MQCGRNREESLGLPENRVEGEQQGPPEDRHALARRLGEGGKQRPVQACFVILAPKWVCEIHIQTPNILFALRGPFAARFMSRAHYTRKVSCLAFVKPSGRCGKSEAMAKSVACRGEMF